MDDSVFSDSFTFRTLEFHRHHYTDNRGGTPIHFLGFMLNGWARLTDGAADFTVCPGDLFYIPKGCRYQSFWHSEDTVRFLSFGFRTYPGLRSRAYRLQKIDCTTQERQILLQLSEHMQVSSLSVGLLYMLFGLVEQHMIVEIVDRHNDIVERAMLYMNRHNHASAGKLAEHCGIGVSTLYLAFRKTVGKTPHEVWQEVQTQKAVELLTTTDLRVEEISDRLGFSSSSHFRRIFTNHTGRTPREVRKDSVFHAGPPRSR